MSQAKAPKLKGTGTGMTESMWPRYPTVYEINTAVWLSDLTEQAGRPIDLRSVPAAEWDAIAGFGFDAVWLMGVWERSPAGIAIANTNGGLLAEFRRALPDFRMEDNMGSPYCVRQYLVDRHLGGPDGLAAARRELAQRGLRLILDFVPNHVAPDHPWALEHPEYFIRGNTDDVTKDSASFVEFGGTVFARGRDPYFPAWPDVLQLNAFHPGLRRAAVETMAGLAGQCDGIRCDMAMLFLNDVFARTWGSRAGSRPATEYWMDAIAAVRKVRPDFRFIAEAYWDLEWTLQQQGFDFCYDKRLYDRLEHASAESVRLHLCAELPYQEKLIRFIENHDEPRAAFTFPSGKLQAAAITMSTLPGARLFYEGQFEGRKVRLPVFLRRRPKEPEDPGLRIFYERLLRAIDTSVFREGHWSLCRCSGWPDNPTYQNLVAWSWLKDDDRYLIIVNLSDHSAQALVQPPWGDLRGKTWRLVDVLRESTYDRNGDEIGGDGLYVDLGAWGCHFFRMHTT